MAQPVAQPTTIQAPKTHPLLIGGSFGIIAAILQILTYNLNNKGGVGLNNGLLGFVGFFVIPLVGLYLAGHYAGRHQRLNLLGTSVTNGIRSVFAGAGSGLATGLIYIIVTLLLNLLPLPAREANNGSGAVGNILGVLGAIGGLIVWPILGVFLGFIGGIFGDSRAHKQLKSGVVVAK